ncbi:MAG: metal-dependent transcriptional regulator [Anaerolineales bacterium]|nr:metal-dependent transcriptional regulator [Anaerolineales bacterium]
MILDAADRGGFSPTIQNYLKTIYWQTREGRPTSTLSLAEALGIRPASVTNMLQSLADKKPGLIRYRKHRGVTLTPKGEKAALQVIRRHRLIEQFLFQILRYPLEKVHPEAEELEHAVSPFFIEQIVRLMQDPNFDPHGHPIPDWNLTLHDPRNLIPLSGLRPGQSGVVRQIVHGDQKALAALNAIGLQPGSTILVTDRNPADGALQIQLLESGQGMALSAATGESIQVDAVEG